MTSDPGESLEVLMLKAQGGDSKAYQKLLKNCERILLSLFRSRVTNPNDLDDLIQEILISIHKSRHSYQPNRPFKPWMFAIANFRLKDHFRSYYKQLNLEELLIEELNEKNSNPDVTIWGEERELLLEAIAGLPEKQRNLVTMAKIEGYSSREISEKLNMSESAVKVSIHRSLKGIQGKLVGDQKE